MDEDVGPVVSFQDFQGGKGSLAQYLLWRTRAAGLKDKGSLGRSMRLALRCRPLLLGLLWQPDLSARTLMA